jgi:hypothetical protein
MIDSAQRHTTTELEVAEFNSREAAKFSYDGLTQARARAHQLLLVLLGGGAGLGGLGLGRVAESPAIGWAALAAGVWWFALALYLTSRALRSSEVRSCASSSVLSHLKEWQRYAKEVQAEGGAPIDALLGLREQLLEQAKDAIEGYRNASTVAYVTLDRVYTGMAWTPIPASGAAAVLFWAQR